MKKTTRKLRSTRGETLVETLVSMLVISLSSATLALMLNTASTLNTKARDLDQKLYEQVSVAEQTDTAAVAGSFDGKITMSYNTTSMSVNIKIYGVTDGLLSYQKEGP